MFLRPERRSAIRGATLLELTTVILVVLILVVLLFPVYNQIQSRLEKTNCIANLRSLHVGADLYLQEHHSWPQIKTDGVDPKVVAANWIAAFEPYDLKQINWLCPSVQKAMENPDMSDSENTRIDYASTPFDTNPQTPFRWKSQPWFVETADMHGNGNLILFPDGHVQELGDFKALLKKQGSGAPK